MSYYDEIRAAFAELKRLEDRRDAIRGLAGMLPDDDLRCTAGQAVEPTLDTCHRHRDHFWCKTCEGWYGVPHDGGMHARGQEG